MKTNKIIRWTNCNWLLFLLLSLDANATKSFSNLAPDSAGIKSLAIYSYDSSSQNTIYANGNMQAPVDIVYDLASGYSFKEVTLKHLYTDAPLIEWSVSNKYNGYLPSVSGGKTFIQKKNTLRRYISTNTPRQAAICVELTASKAGFADSIKSTCNGESQKSNVYITALSPKYISRNDVELTRWDDSTEINRYVDDGGVWSSQIKEQTLKTINSYPKIRSFIVDYRLSSSGLGILKLNDSLLSQSYMKNNEKDVGHIMSWVAHPDNVDKIRFIENVGRDKYWGWLLERRIPYYSSRDPHYILSLVTYKLRRDKFLYQGSYNYHYLCAKDWFDPRSKKCQYYNGKVNDVAPSAVFHASDVDGWKVERPKGIIKLIDDYGTISHLTLGIRPISTQERNYEIFIE
ncbi:hypothetical protein [Aeromonas veronii]|uniref:hypothetical protein n=1 Tax=Aeromonas veronii TaxID=654 RepID=UPI000D9D6EDA